MTTQKDTHIRIGVWVPNDILRKTQQLAKKDDRSLSSYIVSVLRANAEEKK